MRSIRLRSVTLLAVAAIWGVCAVGALAASSDAGWIRKAVSANMLEMRAGRLAAQRDTNRQWQQFGDHMVRDHSMALAQLRALARDKRVMLPAGLAPKDRATYDMLRRRHGRSFDAAYRRFAIASHVQANRLYNMEIDRGRDSDVRAVAAKQLPTVQNHLTMVDHMTGTSMRNLSANMSAK